MPCRQPHAARRRGDAPPRGPGACRGLSWRACRHRQPAIPASQRGCRRRLRGWSPAAGAACRGADAVQGISLALPRFELSVAYLLLGAPAASIRNFVFRALARVSALSLAWRGVE
eukprot:1648261-Alexandrium_andersonii.AAC.1